MGEPDVDERSIGEAIEHKLDQLQSRLEPRLFGDTVELLQLVSELYGAGLARVMQLTEARAPELVRDFAGDDLLASLLVANGLHPDPLEVRVAQALDGVRPFLAGHGGDVELLDVDHRVGAVQIRLLGSCDGCPSSAITLRQTVERAILEAAPEIRLIDVDEPTAAPISTPIELGAKPLAFDPATGCGAAGPPEPSMAESNVAGRSVAGRSVEGAGVAAVSGVT